MSEPPEYPIDPPLWYHYFYPLIIEQWVESSACLAHRCLTLYMCTGRRTKGVNKPYLEIRLSVVLEFNPSRW